MLYMILQTLLNVLFAIYDFTVQALLNASTINQPI